MGIHWKRCMEPPKGDTPPVRKAFLYNQINISLKTGALWASFQHYTIRVFYGFLW